MTERAKIVRPAVPILLTLALLGSRLAAVDALSDPVGGAVPASLHLSVPMLYLLLAPAFTAWDGISMLSMSRLQGLLTGLAVLYLIWRVLRIVRRPGSGPRFRWARELGILLLSLAGLIGFLVLGAMWHRPMLSLAGAPAGQRVVDFHSHSAFSHDVADTWVRGFDVLANRRWHARAGFDAVFLTDHNSVEGVRDARGKSEDTKAHLPVICPGTEVSAWRAHIVMLGDTLPVERDRYSRSLSGLLELLRTSETAYGSLTLGSLPEYRRNHWNRLDTLVAAGLDGLEIVNASPKANELPQVERNRVTALARSHNLFVVGVSDIHGWGATSMVWNLVPTSPAVGASTLCRSVLKQLRAGFSAVRIIERHRLRPDDPWPMWLTAVGMLWETWRSMGWPLTLSWLAWSWLLWLASIVLRSSALRVKIARSESSASPSTDS